MRTPATMTVPVSGGCSPPAMVSKVDLPHPLGPMTAVRVPSRAVRLTPRTA